MQRLVLQDACISSTTTTLSVACGSTNYDDKDAIARGGHTLRVHSNGSFLMDAELNLAQLDTQSPGERGGQLLLEDVPRLPPTMAAPRPIGAISFAAGWPALGAQGDLDRAGFPAGVVRDEP